jgi:hypothetical protein
MSSKTILRAAHLVSGRRVPVARSPVLAMARMTTRNIGRSRRGSKVDRLWVDQFNLE